MKSFTLAELCQKIDGTLQGGDPDMQITSIQPFEDAQPNHITFATNKKYKYRLDETQAAAVIVSPTFVEGQTINKPLILVNNPYLCFAQIATIFFPPNHPNTGISSNAIIGDHTIIGHNVTICPGVVIGNHVKIGHNVVLYPNVVLSDHVVVGEYTVMYPNVSVLERCQIGKRVIIQSGSVIGSDGYGFAPHAEGYYKIPQIGYVIIDDDVEIGANNTIDRGTFGTTHIHKGVKTDNLVHIAHNVVVGEHTVLVAQVGIAGSATIGKHNIIAGQSGINGHITLGNHVIVGPKSGVAKSLPDNQVVSGITEMPHKLWLRVQRVLPKLPDLKKLISSIDKRVNRLEQHLNILES